MSVTTLGCRDGDALGAAAKVINYLDGRSPARGGATPQPLAGPPSLDDTGGIVGYYADSVEGPGMWLGRGMTGVRPVGEVDPEEFRRVLLGQDPRTAIQLLGARGSAGRAERSRRHRPMPPRPGQPDELLSLPQAAALAGVSPRYLRTLAMRTHELRARQAAQRAAGEAVADTPGSYLDAIHGRCRARWRVRRGEAERFATARKAPAVVIGYDLTFSAPKSVSILWATAGPARQAQIVAALDEAVAAGVSYLEENAGFVQGRRRQKASGVVAASYLHATSRALDPQLHRHVVVANMAERADGQFRALDGRPLYAHAKTAGYLAASELRTQLTRRLGLAWEGAERGAADVVGVSRGAVLAMSKRSRAMDDHLDTLSEELSEELGPKWRESSAAHQKAAYQTRAAKDEVDPEALRPRWDSELESVGFDAVAAEACYERQAAPALVTEEDRAALLIHLGSARGVTHMAATFDRRDVICHVAEWAGNRLSAGEVCDLADEWLASEVVVRLDAARPDGRSGDVIRLGTGHAVSAVENEAVYTTVSMLDVEERVFATYQRGRGAGVAVVPPDALAAALSERPELGADQVAMVEAIAGSGQRIQAVVGPAGTGKTRALEAAVRAWEGAGYRPVGAAVVGTAAEMLGDSLGIETSTLASLLTRLDLDARAVLDSRSVVVVDEASVVGNVDLARLLSHVERAGAALRLVGDPAQHSAVAAGGAWRALLERWPDDAATLSEPRRQRGEHMAEVRLALAEYRHGMIDAALQRLQRDARVIEAESADELLDHLVTDWYVDRGRRQAEPTLAPSTMVAEHHHERLELNARARALLGADGTLSGPALEVGGVSFRAGDEVIARVGVDELRPAGGGRRSGLRNGLRGRVVEASPGDGPGDEGHLVVDFERRGPVVTPGAYLAKPIRPGVTGILAHSYALTSHAAQGETYESGRHLATDRSSRGGVYVGLSRGKSDARLYVVRRRDLACAVDEEPELPRLDDEATTLEAVTARLETERAERLAGEVDPAAGEVAALRRGHDLAQLYALAAASHEDPASVTRRALDQELTALVVRARLNPDPALVARLGSRPRPGPTRDAWDRAVGDVATYRARWCTAPPEPAGPGPAWALGAPPTGAAARDYNAVASRLVEAEVAIAASQSTAALAGEHRAITAALVTTPDDGQRRRALAMEARAEQRLAAAREHAEQARSHLQDLQQAPRRRRNAQCIELARRALAGTEQAVAGARLDLDQARERVVALGPGVDAQAPLRARLEVLDAALDAQVRSALEAPAHYLCEALGPRRNGDDEERSAWDAGAERLETYRHRELGLSPADGPVGGDGVEAAIGQCPLDYLDARIWEGAAAVGPDVDLGVAVDPVAVAAPAGLDLGIDL